MSNSRHTILFLVTFLGAYVQYRADVHVKNIRRENQRVGAIDYVLQNNPKRPGNAHAFIDPESEQKNLYGFPNAMIPYRLIDSGESVPAPKSGDTLQWMLPMQRIKGEGFRSYQKISEPSAL